MILGIIQARMSSKRLPGKVLMPICGVPILLFMVERVKKARGIDQLLVATSMDRTDNPIRKICHENKYLCFSGSLDDVLDRFYWAAQIFSPAHIVRMTADCPMIDPDLVSQTIDHHVRGGYDYTRNYGYPDGFDVEVMTHAALCEAWRDSVAPYDREHVTPFFYNRPDRFKLGRVENDRDQSGVKISIDTEEDYQRVKTLLETALWSSECFRNL